MTTFHCFWEPNRRHDERGGHSSGKSLSQLSRCACGWFLNQHILVVIGILLRLFPISLGRKCSLHVCCAHASRGSMACTRTDATATLSVFPALLLSCSCTDKAQSVRCNTVTNTTCAHYFSTCSISAIFHPLRQQISRERDDRGCQNAKSPSQEKPSASLFGDDVMVGWVRVWL